MTSNGKTVSGAGSGIGRAVAVDAPNAGATLILGGRTAAPLDETSRRAACAEELHHRHGEPRSGAAITPTEKDRR